MLGNSSLSRPNAPPSVRPCRSKGIIHDSSTSGAKSVCDRDSMGNDGEPAWYGGTVVIGIAWRKPMPHPVKELAEVEHRVATLYASLELSQSTWLVTSLSPGSVTMSKHSIPAGDGPGLLCLLTRLRTKAERMAGVPVEIVVI